MIFQAIRSLWPSGSNSTKDFDLAGAIEECERQLTIQADDALSEEAGEQTPLFGELPSRRNPQQPGTSGDEPGTAATRPDEELSPIEYSYKPLRLARQILYDFLLGICIGLVWLFDRWYRWLVVGIPVGFYFMTYGLINRKEDKSNNDTANYMIACLVLVALTMVVSGVSMSASTRASLLSNR